MKTNEVALSNPRSQTLFGNALVLETLFRRRGNRVAGTLSFPNRVWERGGVLLIATLFAFATPAASAGSGLRDEITDSFAVKPGGTLIFDSDLANVEITTGDSEALRADFTREFRVSTAQEADALRQKLDVKMTKTDNNAVTITVRWNGSRNDRELRDVRVNFRIAMPRKFNLDLRTVGSARIGDLEATANGGSVSVGRVNGRATVRANGGSVAIDEATDAIDAKAAGGSVAAYISKQPRSDSKLIAEAGNVELRLPESIAINIDAACSAGRLSSDFSLLGHHDNEHWKGTINNGGPLVMVRASAGNIYIRK